VPSSVVVVNETAPAEETVTSPVAVRIWRERERERERERDREKVRECVW
jgi:hypothetical protein